MENSIYEKHTKLTEALNTYVDAKVSMNCAQDRVATLLQTAFNCNTEQSFMLAEGMCEAAYKAAIDE